MQMNLQHIVLQAMIRNHWGSPAPIFLRMAFHPLAEILRFTDIEQLLSLGVEYPVQGRVCTGINILMQAKEVLALNTAKKP